MLPELGGSRVFDYGIRGPHWAAGYHTGRDYQCGSGARIVATRGGRVIHTGRYGGWGQAYGNHVIIDTGSIRHSYNHLSSYAVRAGQTVVEGQYLGRSGGTGNVTGPHLHYEERTSPYTYWNHRRPVFDRSTSIPTLGVDGFSRAYRNKARHSLGRLFKRELRDAMRDRGMRVAPMVLSSTRLGPSTWTNVARLRGRWYGSANKGDIGAGFLSRLGKRRNAWRTR